MSHFADRIQKQIETLLAEKEERETKLRQLRDMVESDEEYASLKESASEASKRASAHKAALMNEPDARRLAADLKDLNEALKESNQALSDYLIGHFVEDRRLEVTLSNGEMLRMKLKATAEKTSQLSLA